MKLKCAMLVALACSLMQAETVFTSFGPGQAYIGSSDIIGSFSSNGAAQQSSAYSFVPSKTYVFNSIDFAAAWFGGPNQLTVLLAADASGVPGGTLEFFSFTNLAPSSAIYSANSLAHPVLTAGTRYWVVLTAQDLARSWLGWNWVSNQYAGLSAYRSGSGAWTAGSGIRTAFAVTGTPAGAPALFDFNADGKSDIFWQHPATGDLWVWFMNGTALTGNVAIGGPTIWRVAGAADFNGDGKPDILWQNPSTGELWVWFMNGTGWIGQTQISPATAWRVVGTGDFNGDGKPDILWQHPSTGEVWVWYLNGATYSGAAQISPPTVWSIAGSADLNGDGKPDLLWQHPASGELWVWYLNGATYAGAAQVSPGTAWKMVGTGDFNGDGKPDLLWQLPATGELWTWLMNGAAYSGAIQLGGATPWTAIGAR